MIGTEGKMFDKVHHVAYVVDDLDKAIAFFQQKLDLQFDRRWVTASGTAELASFRAGDFVFEVSAPLSPTSHQRQVLEERGGPCLDHVGYGVHNLDGVLATLKERGITLRNEGPYIAITGWRVANIDPKTTMGIQVQLVDLDHES